MTFMSPNFNARGVMQRSEKDEQVLILHKNVETYLNTELLAWVFHTNKMDFETQIVIVDDFGSLGNVQAALVDKDWFMVFDKLFQTTNQYNAQGLYTNYWLHHHQVLSTSQYQNAVKFVIDDGVA
jgi:2-succinyl-5-enolpyruvyl-6-hydroxy-3-cyclohexene-1-carboxylate synthase